jgi:hypothetical protein
MITDPEPRRQGQRANCDEPVKWRERFRTRAEQIYRVDACDEHGAELMNRTRIRDGRGIPDRRECGAPSASP